MIGKNMEHPKNLRSEHGFDELCFCQYLETVKGAVITMLQLFQLKCVLLYTGVLYNYIAMMKYKVQDADLHCLMVHS